MKNQMTTDTQSRSAGTARVDREGFAMVTALLVVLVLSVLAVGATWLASSEKKTTVAEALHVRSVFAADAGSEAGINFIRNSESPPMRTHSVDETAIEGTQTYSFDAAFDGREIRPGWGDDYFDYDYRIAALGEAGRTGQSGVAVVVARLYKKGYR
jgi:type II secretory pathway pseudopilin PulG